MVNVSFLEPLCSHGGHLGGPSLAPSLHKLSDDSMEIHVHSTLAMAEVGRKER